MIEPGSDAHQPADADPLAVVAVLVTYNRRDLLLEALPAVLAQNRPPEVVWVVDNASDDGSAAARPRAVSGGAAPRSSTPITAAQGAPTGWRWPSRTVPTSSG